MKIYVELDKNHFFSTWESFVFFTVCYFVSNWKSLLMFPNKAIHGNRPQNTTKPSPNVTRRTLLTIELMPVTDFLFSHLFLEVTLPPKGTL